MTPRLPLALVVASTLAIAAGYASAFVPAGPPAWSAWALAVGTSTLLVAMMLLGARRRDGSVRGLWLPFAVVYLLLLGGLGLALMLPSETAEHPALLLGLPRRAALVIYGIGLVPSAILPFAYARTFDDLTLRPEDFDRIREARERREALPSQ